MIIRSIDNIHAAGKATTSTTVDGKIISCQPGLKLVDQTYLNFARNSGWFLSYAQIAPFIDDSDYVLDFANFDAIDNTLNRLATRIFIFESKTQKKIVAHLDTETKGKIRKGFIEHLFGDNTDGFFVLRLFRDLPFQGGNKVKQELGMMKKSCVCLPAYVTSAAMEKLSRDNVSSLLAYEGLKLTFETTVKEEMTSSDSIFGPDFNALCDKIAKIELETNLYKEDLEIFMEKTASGNSDLRVLENIISQLDQSVLEQNKLRSELESKKVKTNHSHLKVQDFINKQEVLIDDLHKQIKEKENDLKAKNEILSNLIEEQNKSQAEHEEKTKELCVKIESIETQLQKVKAENREMVPLKDTLALEEERVSLEKRKNEVKDLLQKEKFETKKMKNQLNELVEETKELRESLATLRNEQEDAQTALDAKVKENIQLKNQLSNFSHQIQKIKDIGKLSDILTEETEIAEEVASLESIRLKTKKQPRLDVQDVVGLLDQTKISTTTAVSAITHKEVTNLLPKWESGSGTNDFIRKVKKAWNFCQKQDVDEETFVDILRTKLPVTFDELVDDLSDEDQKIVDKICEAISTLDKQKSEYLQDFATARKKASESHVEFAHRIKRYYARGTGNTNPNAGETLALIEAFLNGLNTSEATALRLCASSEELQDLTKLALRASRSRNSERNNKEVSALQEALQEAKKEVAELRENKIPDRQNFQQRRKIGKCHFCNIPGHYWRECRKRARNDPNWRPKTIVNEKKTETAQKASADQK